MKAKPRRKPAKPWKKSRKKTPEPAGIDPEDLRPQPPKPPDLSPPIPIVTGRDKPQRHRVLRCERCRTYLFDIFLVSCEPGTKTSFIVTMKCRNKGCRRTNQVSVDLVNEDVG